VGATIFNGIDGSFHVKEDNSKFSKFDQLGLAGWYFLQISDAQHVGHVPPYYVLGLRGYPQRVSTPDFSRKVIPFLKIFFTKF
jgi:hypothetical protein